MSYTDVPRPESVHTPSTPVRPRRGPHRDKAAWYLPVVLAADAAGVLLPVLLVFQLAGEPHAVPAALVATLSWLAIRTGYGRYGSRSLGESRGLLATLHDWLLLGGLLAVLRVITGESSAVLTALLALTPALFFSGPARALVHGHLSAQRHQAQAVRRVLVVGECLSLDTVTDQLAARTDHAYVVVGAVPVGAGRLASGVPEAGRLDGEGTPGGPPARGGSGESDGLTVLRAARRHDADLVLVAPGSRLTGDRLRRLSWAVQDAGLLLVVASGLTDITRRRVEVFTAAGLNLLHITPPVRQGPQLALKSTLDRTGAAVGLVLLSPVLALLALAVRLDSRGPALYRQTRVGQHGIPFTMWKFRTMVPDAEARRPLLEELGEQNGPLFKMRRDPRVTRLGRFLRRSSLDELPQLVNVVRGEMSLVGPRPPLPQEAAGYNAVEARRLGVRPGMTGPWQISGRSDLSWDESVALDLSYADNWSVTGDLDVLARTVRAVANGRGAY
ncbi:exopolysaccharide biosynthesis polyprenyl glycosylphosphotransferase [Streptomyces sp. ACA25]|uniref:exopolysaccharide biosynthesis polyprenyl glycosylphosphotransferase n=1 Tax=Streptomyces sp. ACA25 TaxID=3022596 RepID=UPI00230720DC|nr:exopolysaccharide biosynthesis polyprenyl glycosylphosphotransferase [Streptomyces sp. ACA25]MDB1087824.1 exopolysaccharide biosynthesis polyprenyl glycosylphosphotransferase [Streptomyces sp. ACA25]